MGCTYDRNIKLGEHLNINYDFLWYSSVFILQLLIYKLRHSTLGINKAIFKIMKIEMQNNFEQFNWKSFFAINLWYEHETATAAGGTTYTKI